MEGHIYPHLLSASPESAGGEGGGRGPDVISAVWRAAPCVLGQEAKFRAVCRSSALRLPPRPQVLRSRQGFIAGLGKNATCQLSVPALWEIGDNGLKSGEGPLNMFCLAFNLRSVCRTAVRQLSGNRNRDSKVQLEEDAAKILTEL